MNMRFEFIQNRIDSTSLDRSPPIPPLLRCKSGAIGLKPYGFDRKNEPHMLII
jgi:hypothetical protein